MDAKLEKKLFLKYTKIFAQRNLSMRETCMCWGCECGDGWYFLIDNLCNCIQNYIDANKHLDISQVEAIQVKEKLGRLAFYISGGDDLIGGMVWLAEHLSWNICEECGSTDFVEHTSGWIYTLCHACRMKNDRAKNLPLNE